MRPYSPGGALITFASTENLWEGPRSSAQRLRLGLPGYLIPFATLAFVPQRQKRPSKPLSPLVFLMISTHFTAPPSVPLTSVSLEHCSIKRSSTVEPWDFTPDLQHRLHPLSPIIPNNVWTVRLTAAAGTNLARPYCKLVKLCSSQSLPPYFRGLQPEGLHPARGIARSRFRALPKILDCSHP